MPVRLLRAQVPLQRDGYEDLLALAKQVEASAICPPVPASASTPPSRPKQGGISALLALRPVDLARSLGGELEAPLLSRAAAISP